MKRIDVVVIGAGPGGYVAARRLAQLGREVVLVEREWVGGTCLNRGCIPTKALYAATEPLGKKDIWAEMGLRVEAEVDLGRLRDWVHGLVEGLRQGIEKLLLASGVELVRGEGQLLGPGRVLVRSPSEEQELRASTIVLATGSRPVELPHLPFDGERVWSSDHALRLPRVPESLVVVGGGVVGLELATVYRRLGAQVTVVELLDRLLPGLGLSRRGQLTLQQALKEQRIEVRLSTKADSISDSGLKIETSSGKEEIPAQVVLVAVGRRPASFGLGLEKIGLSPQERGWGGSQGFQVAEGVYAIGDLRGGAMLAHRAAHEGLAVAEMLVGNRPPPVAALPQAVFTHPEVALVGLGEEEARRAGLQVKVGRFPLGALGRALAEGEPRGHFQLVADEAGRLLGAELVAPRASDLIAEAALAVQAGLSLEDLAATVHAHPTFPEGLWEAALAALGRPLHFGR
jgi:dihydrolipoamide dehydrogenase